MFFHLYSLGRIERAVISDSNKSLINCYVAIRDQLDSLLGKLEELQMHATDKNYYYTVARPGFNRVKLTSGLEGNVEKAGLLIYLNKTCYNGLYRENSRGEFNVPWGRYENPLIYDETALRTVRNVLRDSGIEIRCVDYHAVLRSAEKGDFVYLDPPYEPISPTSSFTDYTSDGFRRADQERLANCVMDLDKRGCFIMLSNSHSRYVSRLYSGIKEKGRIETVSAARMISCEGPGRRKISEYLVTNYFPQLRRSANPRPFGQLLRT